MESVLLAKSSPLSPILPSPNGRYFVDHSGRPVFWLGDTLWELLRLFTPEEALRILRNRQAKGYNVSLIMLLGVDMTHVNAGEKVPHLNLEGEAPWNDNDPLRPNEKYFRHIDGIIRLGEQTGQTFVVGVYHMVQGKVIHTGNARAWARWVARRYRDVPNLIWSMYPRAEREYVPISRELAAGLREGDGGAHLVSVHPDPSVASSSFLHEEPWLAFNMIQTCLHYDRIPETVTADYRRTPVKPVVMAEGHYEAAKVAKLLTPHDVRKQAYWTQLAGGHHVYGHDDAWRFPRKWEQWIDAPGTRYLKIFREVITSLKHWWDLVPDQSLLMAEVGSGLRLNMAARASAGDWIIAYLSEPSTISLRLDALPAGCQAKARWIDPRGGEPSPGGAFPARGTQSFATPSGWEDAFLLLEAA